MLQAAAEQVLPAGRSPVSIPAERLPAASRSGCGKEEDSRLGMGGR